MHAANPEQRNKLGLASPVTRMELIQRKENKLKCKLGLAPPVTRMELIQSKENQAWMSSSGARCTSCLNSCFTSSGAVLIQLLGLLQP
jgi:hypothetical protein